MNAIKAVAPDGTFTAQAIRFGSPTEPDRQRDFFTAKTQLMMDQWGWPRPILWEHGVKAGTFGVVLGQWLSYEKRADGVYLRGRLDTSHPLYAQIKADIDAGRYYVSSDGAPHLVRRARATNGTNEITHWGWITGSLTRSPAEPRLLPATMIKRLALKETADKTDKQRAARIRRELDMLEEDIEDDARRAAIERRMQAVILAELDALEKDVRR